MSNGAQCCALEICCPPGEPKRAKLVRSIATFTGAEDAHCSAFLDWMDQNGLTFAPTEFASTIDAIVKVARAHPEVQ